MLKHLEANISPVTKVKTFLTVIAVANPGGGGGTLIWFFIRRLGPPSISPSSQKISGISSTPTKKKWNFSNPKIYTPFCTLTLMKKTKMHRNDPFQFCDDPPPPPNIHKIFIPPKIFIFLQKTQKIIKIKKFEPPKNDLSLRMYENIRVPPGVANKTFFKAGDRLLPKSVAVRLPPNLCKVTQV